MLPIQPGASLETTHNATLRRLISADLLRDQSEVLIEHGATLYRLRLTKLGKLILTK